MPRVRLIQTTTALALLAGALLLPPGCRCADKKDEPKQQPVISPTQPSGMDLADPAVVDELIDSRAAN